MCAALVSLQPVQSVAVFVDGETLRQQLPKVSWFSLRRALEAAGSVTLSRVYVALSEQAEVQAVGLTVRAAEGDEAVSLALDTAEAMYLKPYIERFCLIGWSRELRPIARRLRELGKRVWVWQEAEGLMRVGNDAEWVGTWSQWELQDSTSEAHLEEGGEASLQISLASELMESVEPRQASSYPAKAPTSDAELALNSDLSSRPRMAPQVTRPPLDGDLPLLADAPWVLVK